MQMSMYFHTVGVGISLGQLFHQVCPYLLESLNMIFFAYMLGLKLYAVEIRVSCNTLLTVLFL